MTTQPEGTAPAPDAAAIAAAAAAPAGSQQEGTNGKGAEGSAFDATTAFAELDTDNRDWLTKQGFIAENKFDAAKLAKQAYNQEKLLGNAIRIPGKDATPEEREAFLNKLGRPATADKYEFSMPKDLPAELPYDGEAAKAYAQQAHKLGLTKEQAAGLHDWFAGQQVEQYKGITGQQAEVKTAKAKAAVDQLSKEWGPIDGETAKANLAFADKVLSEAEPETLKDLQEYGIIGPNKEVFSASLAKLFAKVGAALYKEDGVLKGRGAVIDNPFDPKSENVSAQMAAIKNDPDHAKALIAAAGKKPSDFGLRG